MNSIMGVPYQTTYWNDIGTKSNYEIKDFYKIYIDFPRDDLLKRINLILVI